ncbi:MAG: C1 family peptidase [Acidobacteria bacterium]|nr:C1 family peptidase [Acidobacteriota bacterium]
MKKWVFGICLVGVLAAFLFMPALLSGDEDRADDPVAKRAALQRELDSMRAEMRANGWDFQIGPNPAMQYSIEQLCNFKPELKPRDSRAYEPGDQVEAPAALPSAFMGVASSIKNQASCGSCWAFSTIAGLEAAIMWKGGPEYNLSEQHLVSCNPWGWGCSGGFFAFDMIDAGNPYYPGAMPETCFPYTALDSACAYCASPTWYPAASWAYVGASNSVPSVDAIKNAIYTHGSVSAAIYVERYFQAYTGGVMTSCKTRVKSCNHAIILCGDQVRLQPRRLRRLLRHVLRSREESISGNFCHQGPALPEGGFFFGSLILSCKFIFI